MSTMAEDREWMIDGACTGKPADLFYPTQGHVPRPAVEICDTCTVKKECLDYSIEIQDWEGVWGGVPGRKRRAIAKARGICVD